MSRQADVILPQGDKNYDIIFPLKDANKVALDLSDATSAIFIVQKVGTAIIKFSNAMTIPDPTNGEVVYTVQDGDFDEAGEYYAEIRVTYGTGEIATEETYQNILIKAVQRLPL